MVKFNTNEKPMHFGAKKSTFDKADSSRKNMTDAEKVLWQNLKGKQVLGLRFRRQHPIGQFIVDFYCHKTKLIIEVDGEIHQNILNKEYDDERTYELNLLGLHVIRFTNSQVLNQTKSVVKIIKDYCESNLA